MLLNEFIWGRGAHKTHQQVEYQNHDALRLYFSKDCNNGQTKNILGCRPICVAEGEDLSEKDPPSLAFWWTSTFLKVII